MGTFRHGGTMERIDDVDLMHLERVAAEALRLGVAFALVIDDESLSVAVRVLVDGMTPMELRYDGLIDEERIDDDRLRIMLAAVADSGTLFVPRARQR